MTDSVQGVEFEEDTGFERVPEESLGKKTLTDALTDPKTTSGPSDGAVLMVILAVLLIAGSFYFISSSLEPVAMLGDDIPSKGEYIPRYVQ